MKTDNLNKSDCWSRSKKSVYNPFSAIPIRSASTKVRLMMPLKIDEEEDWEEEDFEDEEWDEEEEE
ncbi:MAG: hypothetical protein ABII71_00245 [Candidatus Micrarchaeota archaeon]